METSKTKNSVFKFWKRKPSPSRSRDKNDGPKARSCNPDSVDSGHCSLDSSGLEHREHVEVSEAGGESSKASWSIMRRSKSHSSIFRSKRKSRDCEKTSSVLITEPVNNSPSPTEWESFSRTRQVSKSQSNIGQPALDNEHGCPGNNSPTKCHQVDTASVQQKQSGQFKNQQVPVSNGSNRSHDKCSSDAVTSRAAAGNSDKNPSEGHSATLSWSQNKGVCHVNKLPEETSVQRQVSVTPRDHQQPQQSLKVSQSRERNDSTQKAQVEQRTLQRVSAGQKSSTLHSQQETQETPNQLHQSVDCQNNNHRKQYTLMHATNHRDHLSGNNTEDKTTTEGVLTVFSAGNQGEKLQVCDEVVGNCQPCPASVPWGRDHRPCVHAVTHTTESELSSRKSLADCCGKEIGIGTVSPACAEQGGVSLRLNASAPGHNNRCHTRAGISLIPVSEEQILAQGPAHQSLSRNKDVARTDVEDKLLFDKSLRASGTVTPTERVETELEMKKRRTFSFSGRKPVKAVHSLMSKDASDSPSVSAPKPAATRLSRSIGNLHKEVKVDIMTLPCSPGVQKRQWGSTHHLSGSGDVFSGKPETCAAADSSGFAVIKPLREPTVSIKKASSELSILPTPAFKVNRSSIGMSRIVEDTAPTRATKTSYQTTSSKSHIASSRSNRSLAESPSFKSQQPMLMSSASQDSGIEQISHCLVVTGPADTRRGSDLAVVNSDTCYHNWGTSLSGHQQTPTLVQTPTENQNMSQQQEDNIQGSGSAHPRARCRSWDSSCSSSSSDDGSDWFVPIRSASLHSLPRTRPTNTSRRRRRSLHEKSLSDNHLSKKYQNMDVSSEESGDPDVRRRSRLRSNPQLRRGSSEHRKHLRVYAKGTDESSLFGTCSYQDSGLGYHPHHQEFYTLGYSHRHSTPIPGAEQLSSPSFKVGMLGSADNLSAKRRHQRKQKMRHRGWGTTPDISEVMEPQEHGFHQNSFMSVSMAASATYIPGGSLSDKLRLAASKGQLDKVQELIVSGATFEPDREGRTALHYAALNGHAEIVQFLANQGCDVDSQDSLGYTALHRAAAQGHLEVIKVLLSEGCLVDRQDEVHGNSALHEAAWNGYSKTLELLLKNNASFQVLNKAGFSGLHLAAQNGHNQSARVLIYAGCDRNQKNNYGDTALHTAARYGHAGVTRILISARCNLSEQNKNGDTALHISAALKRRKIAKLLTECGINTALRNKQNETAVDVAKRKDHPEIVLIVTAAPKDSKKSKKKEKESKKKEKIVVSLPENGVKKEKKGGLFKRRSKSKDKLKDDKPKEQPGIEVPMSRAGSAPSEASSEFTSFMPPQELLKGFKHHQHRQQATHPHYQTSQQSQYSQQAVRGTTTLSHKSSSSKTHPVKGLLSQYVPKNGVQYYRDLAGNVKQGPIGYAPVCSCGPALKKLEKKMDADRDNMYDHIDATQRTLNDRIEGLDKRAAQQVYAIDKLTRERLDAERKDCERRQRAHASQERQYLEDYLNKQQRVHQAETQVFVDSRLTAFERQYSSNHLGAPSSNCDCCPGYEYPKYRDDAAFYSRGRISNAPLPGQLYRCKSDETLSVSSSHPSRRHWKFKPKTLRELKHMNLPKVSDKPKRSRKNRDGGRTSGKQEMGPVGRSPEGNSEGYEYEEPYTGSIYHTWSSRRQPMDEPKERKFQQAEGNSKGALIVRDASNQRMSPSKSVPNLEGGEQALSLPQQQVTQAGGAIYNSARQIGSETPFSSPDQLTVHHSKTDSGSNPDSGYGSRIYGIRPFPGKPPSTSTPANNNNNPVLPDRHDSSIGTNASSITDPSSPAVTFNSGASTDTYHSTKSTFQVQAQVHNPVHNKVVQAQVHNPVHSTMPSYVERWYEKKPRQANSGAVFAGGITPYPEQFGVKPTKPTVEIGRATQV